MHEESFTPVGRRWNVFTLNEMIIPRRLEKQLETHTHTHTHTNPNSIVVARKWAKLISSRAPDENQSGVADSPAADPRNRGPGRNENRSPCHHAASLISHAAGREARDESRFTVTTGESQRCTGQIKKKKNAQSHDHTFTSGRAHPNECRHVTAQTRFF